MKKQHYVSWLYNRSGLGRVREQSTIGFCRNAINGELLDCHELRIKVPLVQGAVADLLTFPINATREVLSKVPYSIQPRELR